MARTETIRTELGHQAPNFTLPDVASGHDRCLDDVRGKKGTVVLFICNHCPYVVHIIDGLVVVAREYMPMGVGFVAISANDITTHPADSPDQMKRFAEAHNMPFLYLHDAEQSVAKAYRAACTPDISVFDHGMKCVYRGRFDGATPGNDVPVTGADLRAALDAMLAGVPLPGPQRPSVGCNIKWRAGNEPDYYR